jgi:integrase
MYPLIVTAACTGMRRGDVCNLDWQAVDLAGNMLTVKTSKTEATVEIPIFPPLREVLIARRPKASGHVFPDAAATLINSRGALTWGFKKIVTRALDASAPQPPPTPTPAAEVEADGTAAIMANVPEGDRRNRMLAIFHAYCAGASVRDIEQRTGTARATVSLHLHAVENWVGKPFMRSGAGRHSKGSITAAIARCTRTQRQPGQMSASTRDWHALRTTFVTLALSAGVPVEIVQRVTGHKTVAVVMEHYFRPDREQFRAVLTDAMPAVLTGAKTPAKTGHDLVTIAAKVSAGTATAAEKELFKRMAALV